MADLPGFVARYELTADEAALVDERLSTEGGAPAGEALFGLRHTAHRSLPDGLVRALEVMRLTEQPPVLVVSGLPVDDGAIGPTPQHWADPASVAATAREELYLVLIGSLLGDVVGWDSLQAGRLVHNVVPIPDEEHEQSGHGSLSMLEWHTEDGFHPYRCDYLGLMALRNPALVATTAAYVDHTPLPAEHVMVLAEPRFVIWPDNEHYRQQKPGHDTTWRSPSPVAVLFGDLRQPYLRIDPTFMSALPGDDEAATALGALVETLERSLGEIVLEPGAVCLLDNFQVVHGRRAFRPAFDGRDRWLKKILVTRDLRRSRPARRRPEERVIAFAGGELQ